MFTLYLFARLVVWTVGAAIWLFAMALLAIWYAVVFTAVVLGAVVEELRDRRLAKEAA